MLQQLWDKISTRIRPDRASLNPIVDFDPEVGSLSIRLEAQVRGQRVTLDRSLLQKGFGFAGYRKFKIEASEINEIEKILVRGRWQDESTAHFEESNVPGCLKLLRALNCRESPAAQRVVSKNAQPKLRVKTENESALRFEAYSETEDGAPVLLDISKLSADTIHRQGFTFYRVAPLPPLLSGSIGPAGEVKHSGNVDRVRELGSAIRESRNICPVDLSPEAELLFHSAESPVPVAVRPKADFEVDHGTVKVVFNEVLPDKNVRPALIASLTKPHLASGVFCEFSPASREILQKLTRLGTREGNNELKITGKGVPEAVEILRGYPLTEETLAAKSIQVHTAPLESRTFLELEDPETLIVRQNLQTSDGRQIKLPEFAAGEAPDWIRVRSEYFHPPEKTPQAPSHGQKVQPGEHRLSGDDIPEFIDADLRGIRQTSRVFADPEFSSVRVVTAAPELQTEIDLDENTSRVKVRPRYKSGSAVLEHSDISKADRKRRYYRRGSTYHRLDWELYEKVREAVGDAGLEEESDGSFTGPSLHYDEIINTFSRLGIMSQTEVFERFLSRLLNFSNIEEVPLPSTLRPEIQVREYQRTGYHWLAFIKKYGLPAVLADEMGLGKTLESLLGVAYLKDLYGRCPSLVVCPAALVNKWFDETDKFFLGLRPFVYWGPRRRDQLRENIGTADLVITTYQTLRSDSEYLARWKWRFLIADEAQRIKNPGIQLVAAIKKIPAEARIAITGTPVENRLRDLWSLFDFLAHGYLGSLSSFEQFYANRIEKWGDKLALEKLLKRTKPFVLRRLKKNVAKELPEKIYKHMRCELTPAQRQLYKAVVDRDLKAAIDAVGGKPLSLGNPHIFAVLTRLKQICCHPGLVTGDFQPYKSGVSGKFDTFIEILEEILEENLKDGATNKLVGISQYVGMTGYLHDYVKSQGKACSLIDGKVPPQLRPEMCKVFNSDPSQFGMMLTLMAGGVGLDLPGANHVVLYDRWWNPAVEDQAIDRVHRIGQEREVIVFTITAKGTLEEKIEQKLAQKRDIFDLVIRPDELLRKEITRDELMELVKLEE